MNHKRIAVVGGGAAGLMAAIAAAEGGGQVTLLEPNDRLGKKLNITGKGRCNVTNNCSREELLQNIPRNGRFLYGAFARFDSRDAMAFFEKLGVPLKTERGNRVFPQSDCAFDVSGALRRRCERLGVKWVRDRAVSVDTDGGRVCGVTGQQGTYPAEAVILATGGVSYPATGSTGDGYRMAAALGHEIVPPCGSLVPLVSGDDACRRMQGLALKNVELTALNGKNKVQFRDFGELLFTHFGVSGPLVLSASAHLRHWDREQYRLSIDLKPALDREKLEARILRDLGENPNRDFDPRRRPTSERRHRRRSPPAGTYHILCRPAQLGNDSPFGRAQNRQIHRTRGTEPRRRRYENNRPIYRPRLVGHLAGKCKSTWPARLVGTQKKRRKSEIIGGNFA